MLGAGEPPRSEFAPKIEEILQTVEDLKERLAEAGAEMLDLKDDLEEERRRVEELQAELVETSTHTGDRGGN